LLKKIGCNHSRFIVFVTMLALCGCSGLRGVHNIRQQPSFTSKEPGANLGYAPIVVFPLHNVTEKPELNWLSIALQKSLTEDLYCISELHTKTLLDFNAVIKKRCPRMTLSCLGGLKAEVDTPYSPLKFSDWQDIATSAKLGQFLGGSYRLEGEDITVHLWLYGGKEWTSQGEMIIKAPLSGLLRESSRQLLLFLERHKIALKPEERERILSTKTESVTAWEQNALGYWWQQRYFAVEKEQKNATAEKYEAYLKKAVAADPDYAEAWCNLGYQRVVIGDLDGATKAFQKALEGKPDMVSAHMGLGYGLAEKGKLTDAISHLEKGIGLNPSLSDYYGYLMNAYRSATLWQKGLKMLDTLERFLKERSRKAERMEVIWWRALFLQELRKFAESKEAYQEVLSFKEKTLGPEHPEVATIVNNLAFLNKSTGEYKKARLLYERALSIDEKTYGHDHPQVAKRLSNLALLYHAMGEYNKAKPLYERALAIDEKVYGDNHPDVAKNMNNLAELHCDLSEYGKAKPLYERALNIYKKVYGPAQSEVATVLSNLARLYHAAGEYAKAKPLYERALAIDEEVYGHNHPDVAKDLSNLAGLYYATGQYGKAKPLYERALSIDKKVYGREHPDVAKDLSNLAGLYYAMGEYDKAKPLYERALSIDERVYGYEHPDVAKDFNNLAELYRALGGYDKAKSSYQRAMGVWEKVHGSNHPNVAIILNNLAELYCDLGKYDKAENLYQRALSIYEKVYGPKHPRVATVLNNLGGLHYKLNEYFQAKPFYERALSIDEEIYGDVHPRVSIRLNNLAELYYVMGNYERARPLYERALTVARTSGQPELLWRVQFNLGYLLAKQKNPYAAIFFGKEAVDTIQGLRTGVSIMSEELQESFLKTKWHVYRFLADLLIDQGRLPEARHVLDMQKEEEYFDFLLRDASLRSMHTTTTAYSDREQQWSKRYREISNRIAALGEEFAELKQKKKIGLTNEEMKRYQQLSNDLKISRKLFSDYLTTLIDDLSSATRERYAEVKEKRLDKPRKLQQALRELGHGAVVIHYLITEDKLRIILTTPEVQLARDVSVSSKELNHKIMDFRTTLQNPRRSPLSQALELYRLVLAPINEDLKQARAKTLMLSLDGALRYLPVAALHDGDSYIAERYLLAVYTAAAGLDIKDKPSARWQVGGFGLSQAVLNLEPLPHVPYELESIIRRDRSDPDGVMPGVIYLDEAFSQESLESVLTARYPVVHIASHFELKPGTHRNSRLVLGDGTTLTLEKIRYDDYDFGGVELLTLSACDTAVGGAGINGSEVESFGTLAQDQGAKGVLATLWPVSDQSTGILMKNFYRLHVERPSMTKAEALHHVQLQFIRGQIVAKNTQDKTRGMRVSSLDTETEKEAGSFISDSETSYTHPFYWAPFILMGNWL
jgi:tetratricopeptide (TPR) repeat protein/CHAT domain-containing protein